MSFLVGQERLVAQLALAIAVVCLLWLIVMQVLTSRQRKAYRLLLRGQDGRNLEQVLLSYSKELDRLLEAISSLNATCEEMDRRLRRCVQHVQMIRFNPFEDTVADQSFAVALLDDRGDGVVLSTLHGRDLTRMYGKPIQGKDSSYPLSPEEQEAIKKASSRPQQ
jgi:type II secretory pathway pseudopilin PulG